MRNSDVLDGKAAKNPENELSSTLPLAIGLWIGTSAISRSAGAVRSRSARVQDRRRQLSSSSRRPGVRRLSDGRGQTAVGRSAVRRCRAAASLRRAEPRNRRDMRPASWWPAAVPRLVDWYSFWALN